VRLICASFRDSSPSNQIGVLYVAIYQRPGETAIRRILGITLPPQLLQTHHQHEKLLFNRARQIESP
jgi:hypothetical protein